MGINWKSNLSVEITYGGGFRLSAGARAAGRPASSHWRKCEYAVLVTTAQFQPKSDHRHLRRLLLGYHPRGCADNRTRLCGASGRASAGSPRPAAAGVPAGRLWVVLGSGFLYRGRRNHELHRGLCSQRDRGGRGKRERGVFADCSIHCTLEAPAARAKRDWDMRVQCNPTGRSNHDLQ